MAAVDQAMQGAWTSAATVLTYFCQEYSKLNTGRVGNLMNMQVISVCEIQIKEDISWVPIPHCWPAL